MEYSVAPSDGATNARQYSAKVCFNTLWFGQKACTRSRMNGVIRFGRTQGEQDGRHSEYSLPDPDMTAVRKPSRPQASDLSIRSNP
jgi:hypothetical protein